MIASCRTKIDRYQATGRAPSVISLIAGPVLAAPPDEPVSRSPYRPDVPRAPGVVAQFLAQPADQDVDRPVVGLPVAAAGLVQDALSRQHPAPAPRQETEERELRRGQ